MKKKNTLFLGIFLKKNKKHIGNIKFESTDRNKNFFWLGILIGDKSQRGKGIGQEVVNKSTEWMFSQKKAHAIYLIVKKNNKIALKVYKNCKFKIKKNLKSTNEFLMVKKNPYIILDTHEK